MNRAALALALLLVGCAADSTGYEGTPDEGCPPDDAHAMWLYNQTVWLPTINDATSEPRNADGSVCFEVGTDDPAVALFAPQLGCIYTSTCAAMWGGPVEVYTAEERDEREIRTVVKMGPCWLFAGGVP